MQNENSNMQDAAQMPPMPPVQVQRGLSTSAGQFTALFTAVAVILSALGYHYSPAQVEGWAQAVNNFATTIGPLLTLIPVIINYVNSRGKIQSNAINAQALMFTGGGIQGKIGGTLGAIAVAQDIRHDGKGSFKDPATYDKILEVAKELGVPGAAHADAVNQQMHPAELIAGIISMFHHRAN